MAEAQGTVLVLGGTGGIGADLVRRLRQAGRDVHVIARDGARLAALAAETGATWTAADATDPAALSAAVAGAPEALSGVVYAIGSITLKPLARLTPAEMLDDFRLNALGAALALQAAYPRLRESAAASVVLFSTIAVAQGFTSHAAVAMAKGAVEGLTRSLAAEWAPRIRVNCIAPSLTRTPLARSLTANETMASGIAALHPLQRLGEPGDAAALAAFLLSAEAGWITGQVLHVDGGRSTLRTKG